MPVIGGSIAVISVALRLLALVGLFFLATAWTVAALSVLGAVLGWIAHQAIGSASGGVAKPAADTVMRWIVEILTFAGLVALFGTSGGLLALLWIVTPALVGRGLALRTSRRVPDSAAALSAGCAADCLTDMELCQAWRASFAALQSASGADERERVAALRAAYLDEMERRAPERFAPWIAREARADGNLRRLLNRVGE